MDLCRFGCAQCGVVVTDGDFGAADSNYAKYWYCAACWKAWTASPAVEGQERNQAAREAGVCALCKSTSESTLCGTCVAREISSRYHPLMLHPILLAAGASWQEEWLAPAFRQARAEGIDEAWRAICVELCPGEVYSFPLFAEAFCRIVSEEVGHFHSSGLPLRQPNSMNRHGVLLADLGLDCMARGLQDMLRPLGRLLFPGPGDNWDGHHCFVVRYSSCRTSLDDHVQIGLDMHVDDSDVTFNVCIGSEEFEGGDLQFCGVLGQPDHRRYSRSYSHVLGHCVAHLGRKRHGAADLTRGERLNLILWNTCSAYRQGPRFRFESPRFAAEAGPPERVCMSAAHDRDYSDFFPLLADRGVRRGAVRPLGLGPAWCPPEGAEYPGFGEWVAVD